MIIRCHGARGSIAVSGAEFLKYGGDTACIEIRSKNDEIIIVDCGTGIRRLGRRLLEEGRFRYSILFTHSHWDHILGFPFFMPIHEEQATLNIVGCPSAQGNMMKCLSRAMSPPLFPLSFHGLKSKISYTEICGMDFAIDSIAVSMIKLSHTNLGVGYKFVEDGRSFVFITDNELGYRHKGGLGFDEYANFVKDADLLIHDAEYTPEEYRLTRTWGHSTYVDALELALKARVRCFGLYHHNKDRTDAAQDAIVDLCRETISTRHSVMECFAISHTTQVVL